MDLLRKNNYIGDPQTENACFTNNQNFNLINTSKIAKIKQIELKSQQSSSTINSNQSDLDSLAMNYDKNVEKNMNKNGNTKLLYKYYNNG